MRLLRLISILLWLSALPACDRSSGLPGMSEEEFVHTMAELRRVERDATLDSAARTTARRNTLQERDLTPEALEAAAKALADDPDRALAVWTRIDSLASALPTDSATMEESVP
jgi:hypothetical protein